MMEERNQKEGESAGSSLSHRSLVVGREMLQVQQFLHIQNRCNLYVLHVLQRKSRDEKRLKAL